MQVLGPRAAGARAGAELGGAGRGRAGAGRGGGCDRSSSSSLARRGLFKKRSRKRARLALT